MANIKFSNEEKTVIVQKLQSYFTEELRQDIGQFDTEFLLDFISEEVGAYFYNRGLYDAQALLASKLDDLSDAIYELERPTEFRK